MFLRTINTNSSCGLKTTHKNTNAPNYNTKLFAFIRIIRIHLR